MTAGSRNTGQSMRNIDELVLTFFAAMVMVSPLAGLGGLLAPLEAHVLLRPFAEAILGEF